MVYRNSDRAIQEFYLLKENEEESGAVLSSTGSTMEVW